MVIVGVDDRTAMIWLMLSCRTATTRFSMGG